MLLAGFLPAARGRLLRWFAKLNNCCVTVWKINRRRQMEPPGFRFLLSQSFLAVRDPFEGGMGLDGVWPGNEMGCMSALRLCNSTLLWVRPCKRCPGGAFAGKGGRQKRTGRVGVGGRAPKIRSWSEGCSAGCCRCPVPAMAVHGSIGQPRDVLLHLCCPAPSVPSCCCSRQRSCGWLLLGTQVAAVLCPENRTRM